MACPVRLFDRCVWQMRVMRVRQSERVFLQNIPLTCWLTLNLCFYSSLLSLLLYKKIIDLKYIHYIQCLTNLLKQIYVRFLTNYVRQGSASKFGIGPKNISPLDGGLEYSQRIIEDIMKNATRVACDRLLQCLLLLVMSCYTVVNPVGGQSLTKKHICVVWCCPAEYVSGVECQQFPLHASRQERSQKGDSGCASEKLGVPHL